MTFALTVVGLAVSKQRRTMGLQSKSFKDDPKLEACLVSDPAHIFRGATGDHVRKIQDALIKTDGASIDRNELDRKFYGNSTAQAVLNFKTNRKRLIRNYKGEFDDIVGVKTIRALDLELAGVTNPTQKDLALLDKTLAEDIVRAALRTLNELVRDLATLQAGTSLNLGTPRWEALQKHFHLLPQVSSSLGRAVTQADLDFIKQNYQGVLQVFLNSSLTFRNGPPVSDDAPARGSFADQKIFFGTAFKDFDTPDAKAIGPNSRAAMLVHEAIHLTDNRSGEPNIHISEFDPLYDKMSADEAIHNSSSYATFAWHVKRGFDQPRFGGGAAMGQ
jgi:hypothetical protein